MEYLTRHGTCQSKQCAEGVRFTFVFMRKFRLVFSISYALVAYACLCHAVNIG